MKRSEILVYDQRDMEDGLKNFELRGHIPDNIFHTHPYRAPSLVMKPLYRKAQEMMIKHHLAKPCEKPRVVNPFLLVAKKNQKMPATTDAVNELSFDELRKKVKIV